MPTRVNLRNYNLGGVERDKSISLKVFKVSCEDKEVSSVVDSTHTTWYCVTCQIKKAQRLDGLLAHMP